MGRLIDADLLDNEIMHLFISITGNPKQSTVVNECKSTFRRMIDEQPTAYNPEEVVKQLEEMKPDIECFDDAEDYKYDLNRHNKYVEIIRNGGVKNE